jgi:hypothetical protein
MTTLSSDESVLKYAADAQPQEYARDLAERMIESARESHDFAALTRWVRRFTDLDGKTEELAG